MAARVWALPFLTALVPSERTCREQGRRHKTLLDVGRQLALQARGWLPGRDLVLLGDSSFSALAYLDAVHRGGLTAITRLRLDAALAARLPTRERRAVAATAWYPKPQPTFSDALAAVRRAFWREQALPPSRRDRDRTKPRLALPAAWVYALCNAA